jgi:hypothetical protein
VEARFLEPVQTDPGVHPNSCTRGTVSLSRGVKRPGRDIDHPSSSIAEVKERVELYLHSSSGPSWPLLGVNFTLSFHEERKYVCFSNTSLYSSVKRLSVDKCELKN